MTPLLWGRAAISVLCAVTALWVAFLMRRRRQTGNTRPEDQTRRVLWILTALAVALFLGIDPLGRKLGGSIGQPFLLDHLKHLCGLVAGMNALAAAESIRGTTARYRPPSGSARLRQAWPVVALSLFAFYWASPNRADLLEMRRGLGGWTGTTYWLTFMGYFMLACLPFTMQCFRYVGASRTPSALRSGILFLGIGGLLSCIYAVNKLLVVGEESGPGLRNVALATSRLAVIVSFTAICYGVWRSRSTTTGWFRRWTDSLADLTRARTLGPMSRALREASPAADVHLTVLSPALILATRENTTRDAIADLVAWVDPQDAVRIQEALAAQRDDEAVVLATSIELARRRMLDGIPSTGGRTPPQPDDSAFLQRLSSAWPEALNLADVVEAGQTTTVPPGQRAYPSPDDRSDHADAN